MKVSELIEKLKSTDPERRVVVNGYEGGVNDVLGIEDVMIYIDVNSAWYYGRHEVRKDGDCPALHIQ